MEKKKMDPYEGRMRAMLIFAFCPLLILLAQPLGHISVWVPVILIGIAATAHQSWSANIFSTVSDMFPKYAVATITGIGGMAGDWVLSLSTKDQECCLIILSRRICVFLDLRGLMRDISLYSVFVP
jgi:ACS family hexuronate transporter-like MFS transporter